MNKNMIWGVIGAVAVVAIAAYVAFQTIQPANQTPSGVSPTDQPGASEVPGTQRSLKELLALNVSQRCTFSDGATQGTAYLAGGKIRTDASAVVAGTTTMAHMILDNGTMYVWTDKSEIGFKASVDNGETVEDVDLDKQGNYECQTWVTDESVFALPNGIEFTDLNQFVPSTNK